MTTSTLDTVRVDTTPDRELSARLREAMSRYPSGVTIVTAADFDGTWAGFTATSFCSLSADPALVLVCLAKSAQCHPVFLTTDSWVIHLVPPAHADLALKFATRGADKFSGGEFAANAEGLPVLGGSCAVLECDAYARHDGGDHTILVGRVTGCRTAELEPAIYYRRGFHTLPH